ncbi:MAG: hypothetical protein ACXVY9_02195 [Terriglobales bacterium]
MVKRPKGIVRIFSRGALVWECRNLFVNAGLPALANLIAGVTSGQYALAVGFGSGPAAPTVADTDLSTAPKYYNSVGIHTFPNSGSVQFNYALSATADYGALGMTVQEVGLFANGAAAAMPAALGTANPAWAASTAWAAGSLVVDANGNIQRCTTAGTGGSGVPTWATALGATTGDGSAVWTAVALHAAPSPMLAHAAVPAFAFDGSANYQGTWTFTF